MTEAHVNGKDDNIFEYLATTFFSSDIVHQKVQCIHMYMVTRVLQTLVYYNDNPVDLITHMLVICNDILVRFFQFTFPKYCWVRENINTCTTF